MMDFLNVLFGYEYFGPILFAIIAILIVIFFIVLFFGKKDEKERKLEETRRLELAQVNAFKDESESVSLEVSQSDSVINEVEKDYISNDTEIIQTEVIDEKEEEEETKESILMSLEAFSADEKEEDKPLLSPLEELPLITNDDNEAVTIDIEEPEKTMESVFKIEPSIPTNIPKYSFEELANSIARELAEVEKLNSTLKIEKEEKLPEVKLESSNVEVTSIKEIQKKNVRPVFSSVFVEPVIKEEVKEQPEIKIEESAAPGEIVDTSNSIFAEEPLETSVESKIETPKIEFDFSKLKSTDVPDVSRPKVELPKTIEMPKKKEEVEKEKDSSNTPDFSNIEGESYNIK